MKKEDFLSNVKFLSVIEKNPIIWNYSIPCMRGDIGKAWKNVAVEVEDKEEVCRERWRTIKNSFLKWLRRTRGVHDTKKRYYLADYLQFVVPFLRIGKEIKEKMATPHVSPTELGEVSSITNGSTGIYDTSGNVNENEVKMEVTKNNILKRSRKSLKAEHKILLKWLKTKRQKMPEDDSDELFARSLVKFMKEMTSKQNICFRQKVMGLVDTVFETIDKTPPPPTTLGIDDNSSSWHYKKRPRLCKTLPDVRAT